MFLNILRGLFVLLMAAVAWSYLNLHWLVFAITVSVAVLFVCIDILSPRRKLVLFSGLLFGLVVGLAITFVMHFVVELLVDLLIPVTDRVVYNVQKTLLINYLTLIVGLVSCYLSISFVLQTKDDIRFIIPYVEFTKKIKGARPLLVDTSALIDGRISDVVGTGIVDSQLVVPRFVLQELQAVADSGDKLKRNRGRRGLDVLTRLRQGARTEVILYEGHAHDQPSDAGVDEKLMNLAKELNGRVLTNDYNLNKVAQLRGVDVINLNDLAGALRPVVLPGEKMTVRLIKPGEAAGQGVGYLEDGTMVVVEQGRSLITQEVEFTVTSALQTSAGRMIFGRLPVATGAPAPSAGRRSSTREDHSDRASEELPSK
jgi:uncharacterized protein YacL